MAANRPFQFGPVPIANAVGDILNPGTTSGGVNDGAFNLFIILRQVRIVNKTAGAVTCSFYLGAAGGSAAGTEVIGNGLSIAANSYLDVNVAMRLDSTQFLTAVASAATSLVISGFGEIGVA